MSRTTDDPKQHRISVRLSNETFNKLNIEQGKTVSDCIRELISPVGNEDSSEVKQLKTLAKDLRLPFDVFIEQIIKLVDEGTLMVEGKELVAKENGVDLAKLFDVCKQTKMQPQKVIDNTVQNMLKGGR